MPSAGDLAHIKRMEELSSPRRAPEVVASAEVAEHAKSRAEVINSDVQAHFSLLGGSKLVVKRMENALAKIGGFDQRLTSEHEMRVKLESTVNELTRKVKHMEMMLSTVGDEQKRVTYEADAQRRQKIASTITKCVNRMARSALTGAFNGWKERARLKKTLQKLSNRLQHRGTALAFDKWYRVISDSKKAKNTMKKALMRMGKVAMSRCFQTWTGVWRKAAAEKQHEILRQQQEAINNIADSIVQVEAEKEREKAERDSREEEEARQKVEAEEARLLGRISRCTSMWQQRSVASTFEDWASVAAEIKRRRHVVERCLNRIADNLRLSAFNGWRHNVADVRHSRAVLTKAVARFTHMALARAFSPWAQAYITEKMLRLEAEEEEERLRLEAEAAEQQEQDRAAMHALFERRVTETEEKLVAEHEALQAKLKEEAEQKHKADIEKTVMRGLKKMLHQNIATAFERWKDLYVSARRGRVIMEKVLRRFANQALSRAFGPWIAQVREAKSRAQQEAMEELNAMVSHIQTRSEELEQKSSRADVQREEYQTETIKRLEAAFQVQVEDWQAQTESFKLQVNSITMSQEDQQTRLVGMQEQVEGNQRLQDEASAIARSASVRAMELFKRMEQQVEETQQSLSAKYEDHQHQYEEQQQQQQVISDEIRRVEERAHGWNDESHHWQETISRQAAISSEAAKAATADVTAMKEDDGLIHTFCERVLQDKCEHWAATNTCGPFQNIVDRLTREEEHRSETLALKQQAEFSEVRSLILQSEVKVKGWQDDIAKKTARVWKDTKTARAMATEATRLGSNTQQQQDTAMQRIASLEKSQAEEGSAVASLAENVRRVAVVRGAEAVGGMVGERIHQVQLEIEMLREMADAKIGDTAEQEERLEMAERELEELVLVQNRKVQSSLRTASRVSSTVSSIRGSAPPLSPRRTNSGASARRTGYIARTLSLEGSHALGSADGGRAV